MTGVLPELLLCRASSKWPLGLRQYQTGTTAYSGEAAPENHCGSG